MVKIFTICTDGHCDFANTLAQEVSRHTNYSLEIQVCDKPCGDFGSSEFYDIQKFKIHNVLNFLTDDYEFIIYLDSDIAIFGNIVYDMVSLISASSYDIMFQRDRDSYCAGMFICKNTQNVKEFFEHISKRLENEKEEFVNTAADQTIINSDIKLINAGLLSDTYTTFGNIDTEKRLWDNDEFDLPSSTIAFHANFTIGHASKEKLLKYVRCKI